MLGWSLSLIVMTSIVYGLYETTFGPALSVLYTTLSHSAWAICLAWILIACLTGHGGECYVFECTKVFSVILITSNTQVSENGPCHGSRIM